MLWLQLVLLREVLVALFQLLIPQHSILQPLAHICQVIWPRRPPLLLNSSRPTYQPAYLPYSLLVYPQASLLACLAATQLLGC